MGFPNAVSTANSLFCVFFVNVVIVFSLAANAAENESFLKAKPHYLTNIEVGELFAKLQDQHPSLAQKYSLGKTLQQRDMNALVLSASSGDSGDLLRPMIKVTANIHGDETLGRQMILFLAQYLTENYETMPEVQRLLNTTEIHLLPSCNPDGFAAAKVSDRLLLLS